MPVLSGATTPASFRDRRSYSRRGCLPGNAVSTLLECLPTFSGKGLADARLARAIRSVVDRIPGS